MERVGQNQKSKPSFFLHVGAQIAGSHNMAEIHLTIYVFIYDVGKEALPSPILTLLLLLQSNTGACTSVVQLPADVPVAVLLVALMHVHCSNVLSNLSDILQCLHMFMYK